MGNFTVNSYLWIIFCTASAFVVLKYIIGTIRFHEPKSFKKLSKTALLLPCLQQSYTKNNQGFVLVYVLGLVAFISAALVMFQAGSYSFIQRLDGLLKQNDALYMAFSPVVLTEATLRDDLQKGEQDGVGDAWYRFRKARSFPVDGGEIALSIRDAGAVPDINSLSTGKPITDNAYTTIVQKYLSAHGVSRRMVANLRDWVDVDNQPNVFGGVEASGVTGAKVANKNILSPADVRLVRGYDSDTESLLTPIVSYLPVKVTVNVNTISPQFLEALFEGQNPRVSHVITRRERELFIGLGDFYESLGIDKPTKAVELGSQTTYFTTYAKINMYGVEKKVETLFERRLGKIRLRRILWN